MMRPEAPGQVGARVLYYAEDHCALRWPLLASGIFAPVMALALFVVSVVVGKGTLYWVTLGAAVAALLCWTPIQGMLMPYVWPAGLRLDSYGVHIGGVRWAERHPGRTRRRRKRKVAWQCAQVFSCPWDGVRRVGISRRRDRIRQLVRYARYRHEPTLLGNLAAPFTRAVLVIWIVPERADLPAVRPAGGPVLRDSGKPTRGEPIWVVPTRRPEELQAALATLPLPAGIVTDPLTDPFGE
jgi:hypothetical protein